jgi:hypothetical protein
MLALIEATRAKVKFVHWKWVANGSRFSKILVLILEITYEPNVSTNSNGSQEWVSVILSFFHPHIASSNAVGSRRSRNLKERKEFENFQKCQALGLIDEFRLVSKLRTC